MKQKTHTGVEYILADTSFQSHPAKGGTTTVSFGNFNEVLSSGCLPWLEHPPISPQSRLLSTTPRATNKGEREDSNKAKKSNQYKRREFRLLQSCKAKVESSWNWQEEILVQVGQEWSTSAHLFMYTFICRYYRYACCILAYCMYYMFIITYVLHVFLPSFFGIYFKNCKQSLTEVLIQPIKNMQLNLSVTAHKLERIKVTHKTIYNRKSEVHASPAHCIKQTAIQSQKTSHQHFKHKHQNESRSVKSHQAP